jgi:hypothetical protein
MFFRGPVLGPEIDIPVQIEETTGTVDVRKVKSEGKLALEKQKIKAPKPERGADQEVEENDGKRRKKRRKKELEAVKEMAGRPKEIGEADDDRTTTRQDLEKAERKKQKRELRKVEKE